jgi:hypothetical protein
MTEEMETPTPEPVVETEVVEEAPDPLAEERAALKAREAELQKGFDKIAREKRELEAARAVAPADDDDEFDPEAMKVLEKALAKTPYAQSLQNLYVDMAETELQRYAEANKVDPDVLRDTIADSGLLAGGAPSLRGVQSAIKKAHKLIQADSFDPEKAAEEAYKKALERIKEEGIAIEDIKPNRAEPGVGKADFFDEDLSPDDRYRIAIEKTRS